MNAEREGIRPFKTLKYLVFGILLCLAVGAAGFLGGRYAASRPSEPELSAVVLENQLAEISELASVSYHYTNMAQFENKGDFYGITIPFTTKRFILTYDGIIKAGVNLRGAQVSVLENRVTVTLPQAEILSHELDENSVEVFDERNSLFNPLTVEDFTAFQTEQKAAMETKALESGLLEEAREAALNSVRLLLSAALPEDAVLTLK